jgi:hypothetical protein
VDRVKERIAEACGLVEDCLETSQA